MHQYLRHKQVAIAHDHSTFMCSQEPQGHLCNANHVTRVCVPMSLCAHAGSSAAGLLAQILDHVGVALVNKDNLTRLMERCADLLSLVVNRLERSADTDDLKTTQAYRSLMSRFNDLLQVGQSGSALCIPCCAIQVLARLPCCDETAPAREMLCPY